MYIKVVIDYSKYMGMKYDQDSILAFIRGKPCKAQVESLNGYSSLTSESPPFFSDVIQITWKT